MVSHFEKWDWGFYLEKTDNFITVCVKLPLLPVKNEQSLAKNPNYLPRISTRSSLHSMRALMQIDFQDGQMLLATKELKSGLMQQIRKFNKEDSGQSLGFGEVKLTRAPQLTIMLFATTSFVSELFVRTLTTLQAAFAFQVNGVNIIFYLIRSRHDGIYIMQGIGRVAFPASLRDLASFLSLENIRTLLTVSGVFWRLCKPVNDDSWEVDAPTNAPRHLQLDRYE